MSILVQKRRAFIWPLPLPPLSLDMPLFNILKSLSKMAGFKIPKGAGSQVDVAAARLIKEKGTEVLPSFVKLHFANTEKAMNLLRKS